MSINTKNNVAGSPIYGYTAAYTKPSFAPSQLQNFRPAITNPYARDLSLVFTPELSKAVSDRCRALFEMNKKEKFINGSLPVSELHKKVDGISKLHAYISTDPLLSKFGMEYSELEYALKDVFKERMPIDFDFFARKKGLENLRRFAAAENNKNLFDIIGRDALASVVLYNEDLTRNFDDEAVENMRKLVESKALAPLRKKFKPETYLTFMKKDESSKIVRKNIEFLEKELKKPENAFLRKSKCLSKNFLLYKGNTAQALKILQDANASLSKDEILNFFVDIESGELRVQKRREYKGGLKIAENLLYDKNMKLTSSQAMTAGISSAHKKTRNSLLKDFKHNTEHQIREVYDPKTKTWIMTDQTKLYKDKNGKVVKTEVWKISDVSGVYNIKSIDAKGKIKTVSTGLKTKEGILIEKNLTSPAGDTTTVRQFRAKNGTKESISYIIKDKNGKVLGQRESLFKKLSPSKSVSVVNGERFNIEYLKDKITVLNDKTKELKVINLTNILADGQNGIMNLLKRLSGPELFAVSDNVKRLGSIIAKDSHYMPGAEKIECAADRFIFDHELGHAIDSLKCSFEEVINDGNVSFDSVETKVASDKKLQKIFNAEKNNFKKSFNRTFKLMAGYFFNDNVGRKELAGLREAIAEVYAIKNNQIAPKWIMSRIHLLQENCPRTIALLLKL